MLLIQDFTLILKYKKGVENVVADHLSRIHCGPLDIRDEFPDENLFALDTAPWYADLVNYLAVVTLPEGWSKPDGEKFLAHARYFMWDDPFLFKVGLDGVLGIAAQKVKYCPS